MVGLGLFCCVPGEVMRGNGLKSHQGRFSLGIRKKKITERLIQYWNNLPRDLESPYSVFQRCLDVSLGNMVLG